MTFPEVHGKTKHSIIAITNQPEKLKSIPLSAPSGFYLILTKRGVSDYYPWFTTPGAGKKHNCNLEEVVSKCKVL